MGLVTLVRLVAVVSAGLLAGIFIGHRAGVQSRAWLFDDSLERMLLIND